MLPASKRTVQVFVGNGTYHVQLEPDAEYGGYVAEVAGLPGCITQGDTADEVIANAADAIDAYLAAQADLAKHDVHIALGKGPKRGHAEA